MARNIYFLLAMLLVFGIGAVALSTRSCTARRIPSFIDQRVSLEEAELRSEQSGKPVFILVAADWCPHCDRLKRGALVVDRLAAWIREHTEPVYVDATRIQADPERGQTRDPQVMALMDKLKVDHLPAMILQRKGVQLGHVEGNQSAADLLKWAEDSTRGAVTPGG